MKEVIFSLREFCEVKALKTIMKYCGDMGYVIFWRLLNFSVNTDFNFCSIETSFQNYRNVSVIQNNNPQKLSGMKIYGFKTDMNHPLDMYIHTLISCSETSACKLYNRSLARFPVESPRIVLGNVKIKSPVEDFQGEIFSKLAQLPYQVVVVPRHPLTKEEIQGVEIPKKLELRNTMGELESLQASSQLTIMGRIFSADGLKPDDDHNPLEATINSNAICGIIKEIPDAYRWLYGESGLMHQCSSFEKVFSQIDDLIFDPNLQEKLKSRDRWIMDNRQKYLKKVVEILNL